MTITTWPAVLKARSWNAHLRNLSASGGTTPTGRTQRVFGDAGLWEVAVSGLAIRDRGQAQAYRALIARLRAGEDILLPVRDCYQPIGSRMTAASVSLSGGHALRATSLALTVSGIDLVAGTHLTIGDRLHLVTAVAPPPAGPPLLDQVSTDAPWSDEVPWSDDVAASGAYQVNILPPLRADQPDGTLVRVRDLALRCVLKDVNDGDLDLDLGRFGSPSLTFIESL